MSTSPVPAATSATFGVVVPVKPLSVAKSRLATLGDEVRRELVAAFALDSVLAAADAPVVAQVLVVTDDIALARSLEELGVAAIPDGRPGDLNETLRQGAAELLRRHPDLRPTALCADLPTLRPEELAQTLAAAPRDRPAFVCDAAGVGTTVYTAPVFDLFTPAFGSGSRRAHLDAGATQLAASASVSRDVDTVEDLRAALELGVGPRSSWVVTQRLPRL